MPVYTKACPITLKTGPEGHVNLFSSFSRPAHLSKDRMKIRMYTVHIESNSIHHVIGVGPVLNVYPRNNEVKMSMCIYIYDILCSDMLAIVHTTVPGTDVPNNPHQSCDSRTPYALFTPEIGKSTPSII